MFSIKNDFIDIYIFINMKVNELKSILRTLVSEEVKQEVSKQLPKLLFEMVGRTHQTVTDPKLVEQVDNNLTKPRSNVTQPTRPIKQYTKNPILNAVLNETTPGLPSTPYENSGVPIPEFDKIGESNETIIESYKLLNERNEQTTQPLSEDKPTNDLSRLFNKNFKAILDKSRKSHGIDSSKVLQSW
jgi:phosphomevalonate kinase